MNQKEYWNDVAETKEFSTPFQTELFFKYVEPNAVVLDVGCGYGRALNELQKNGYQNLIGIDFSEEMIKRARKNNLQIDYRVKKNEKIDLPDESVDAVILLAVLTCITSKEEQKKLISEIHRVLKKGGILYINDFIINDDERNIKRYKEFEPKYGYGGFDLPEGGSFRHHSVQWIEELLSNFEQKCFERVVYPTMNGHKSNGFYYFGMK